ncbi:unnamed protein product [Rhizophagus irregularis]|nr:unnamed protein product [Rhizophagus irregularis]
MLYNLQVILHGRRKNSRDTSCFNDTSTINGQRTMISDINGRTNGLSFSFSMEIGALVSFGFSRTDKQISLFEGFLFFLAITNSLFWIDEQKIQDFRSISTLRAVLFPERTKPFLNTKKRKRDPGSFCKKKQSHAPFTNKVVKVVKDNCAAKKRSNLFHREITLNGRLRDESSDA